MQKKQKYQESTFSSFQDRNSNHQNILNYQLHPQQRRSNHTKFSLKHHRSHATEKSTTCNSTYGHSSKKSIKNLLVVARGRNNFSQNSVSMRYLDIQEKVEKEEETLITSILNNLFCKTNNSVEDSDDGCHCSPKCLWAEHWLELALKNTNKEEKKQQQGCVINSKIIEQIKRDLPRTQPKLKCFKNQECLEILGQTLFRYARIDEQIGYVQGMNIIASIVMYHARNLCDSFDIFKFLMISCKFRQLYLNDFQRAHQFTEQVLFTLHTRCNDLYHHTCENHGVQLGMFILGWLIPMLGNIVPAQCMHLIINIFLEKGWEGILKIVVSFLLYMRVNLLQSNSDIEIMQQLSVQAIQKNKVNWQEIILSSRNVKLYYI